MKPRKALRSLPLLGGAIALTCAVATASAQTETFTFTETTTDRDETGSLPGNPCAINQELTEVSFSSNASVRGAYSLENTSDTSISVTEVTQELVALRISVPGLPGPDELIDESLDPQVFNVNLPAGGSDALDPTYQDNFDQPPPPRVFSDPADLSFFDVSTFDVNFFADANDTCQFTTGNSICNIETFVQGSVSVTYTCTDLEPELICETKTLSPTVLDSENGVVNAAFTIRNTGEVDFTGNLEITDTMDPGMELVPGSVSPNPPGDPVGGPPTYTWSGLSLPQGDALTVNYQANITGLGVGETMCNVVVAEANGTSTAPEACRACVTREDEPPPVPAISLPGILFLGGALSGIGLLFGFRRRM